MTKTQIIKTFTDFGHYTGIPKLLPDLFSADERNQKIKLTDSRVFFGISGNGKSREANLLFRDYLCDKFPEGFTLSRYQELPSYVRMPFFEKCVSKKNGFDSDKRYSAGQFLEESRKAEFLVIDDLWQVDGTPKQIQDIKRELFELFDYRYNYKLQTIITSNLALENLQNLDEDYKRIVDRILGLCVPTKFTAPSFRIANRDITPKTLETF